MTAVLAALVIILVTVAFRGTAKQPTVYRLVDTVNPPYQGRHRKGRKPPTVGGRHRRNP
ncbi:MAG: hypothetical protein ACRDP6_47200 [Actinoallomurus sp.]